MSDEMPQVELLYSDEFKARLRSLAKRYRKIQEDLQPVLKNLQAGNFEGDHLTKIRSRLARFEKLLLNLMDEEPIVLLR
jgi:mRNA-degrading endonuclease RelE of RelBE toxin-antitoxin system